MRQRRRRKVPLQNEDVFRRRLPQRHTDPVIPAHDLPLPEATFAVPRRLLDALEATHDVVCVNDGVGSMEERAAKRQHRCLRVEVIHDRAAIERDGVARVLRQIVDGRATLEDARVVGSIELA